MRFFHISAITTTMLHCCCIHPPLYLPQDDDPFEIHQPFEMHKTQQQCNIVVVVAKM
jgi:hypothetical protein